MFVFAEFATAWFSGVFNIKDDAAKKQGDIVTSAFALLCEVVMVMLLIISCVFRAADTDQGHNICGERGVELHVSMMITTLALVAGRIALHSLDSCHEIFRLAYVAL